MKGEFRRLLVMGTLKILAFISACAVGACFAATILTENQSDEQENPLGSLPEPLEKESSGLIKQATLVMGVDEGGFNTDSIFILEAGEIQSCLTQVPRDGRVFNSVGDSIKINSMYGSTGIYATRLSLSNLTGKAIANHLVVDLKAVIELADILGGIEITVPKKMYYVDNAQELYIDLEPGNQILLGEDLEGFLRWRADSSGDYGRMSRQQTVIQAAIDKIRFSPDEDLFFKLISLALQKTNTNLSAIEMLNVLKYLKSSSISMASLGSEPLLKNRVWYQIVDWKDDLGLLKGCTPK